VVITTSGWLREENSARCNRLWKSGVSNRAKSARTALSSTSAVMWWSISTVRMRCLASPTIRSTPAATLRSTTPADVTSSFRKPSPSTVSALPRTLRINNSNAAIAAVAAS
jgi:hypothetical protein